MNRARVALVSIGIGGVIAGAGYLAHPPTDPIVKGPPVCSHTALPGEFRCTFPTHSHMRATVYVQTFEDGSARALAVDPDRRNER